MARRSAFRRTDTRPRGPPAGGRGARRSGHIWAALKERARWPSGFERTTVPRRRRHVHRSPHVRADLALVRRRATACDPPATGDHQRASHRAGRPHLRRFERHGRRTVAHRPAGGGPSRDPRDERRPRAHGATALSSPATRMRLIPRVTVCVMPLAVVPTCADVSRDRAISARFLADRRAHARPRRPHSPHERTPLNARSCVACRRHPSLDHAERAGYFPDRSHLGGPGAPFWGTEVGPQWAVV